MDPDAQPNVFSILAEIEEMLIACVSPILQVRHALGGKYKYSGHTICFPQQTVKIEIFLPRHLSDIDILVVKRNGTKGNCYACYVTKSHVLNALLYKMQHKKFIMMCKSTMPQFHHFHKHAL